VGASADFTSGSTAGNAAVVKEGDDLMPRLDTPCGCLMPGRIFSAPEFLSIIEMKNQVFA
jgi:hypothetical protein